MGLQDGDDDDDDGVRIGKAPSLPAEVLPKPFLMLLEQDFKEATTTTSWSGGASAFWRNSQILVECVRILEVHDGAMR
jgi:hypothetical protein